MAKGAELGASFNSLFEMRGYIPLSRGWKIACFNSLFEMPSTATNQPPSINAARSFNSLFEMRSPRQLP